MPRISESLSSTSWTDLQECTHDDKQKSYVETLTLHQMQSSRCADCIQAYLLVWLYTGVHNLAGLRGTALRQRPGQQDLSQAPPAWQAAAGVLAAQGTPWEILAGTDVLNAADNVGKCPFIRSLYSERCPIKYAAAAQSIHT